MLSEGHQFVLPALNAGREGDVWHLWVTKACHSFLCPFSPVCWPCKAALSMHCHPLPFFTPLAPDWPALVSQLKSWETRAKRGPGGPSFLSLFHPCARFVSLWPGPWRPCQLSPSTCPPAQFLPPVARGDRANCHHLYQGARGENQGPGNVPIYSFLFLICLRVGKLRV